MTSSRRDEIVLATKAGISRRSGQRVTNTSRGHLLDHPRRVARAARRRPRRPVAGARVDRRDPARGDAHRARPGRHDRAGVVRRRLQLHRVADRPGRHLAARRAGPGDPGVAPRSSTRCSTGTSSRRCCPPPQALGLGVLPWSPLGRGRADRQVPLRHAVGLARRVRRTSAASSAPTSTSGRRAIVEARRPGRRRARLVPARGGTGVGPRPAGRHRPDRGRAHRRPAARGPRHRGADPARARSSTPSTTCAATDGSRAPSTAGPGVEWEFETVTLSREFSRNVVTRLLVERAEHGGWELDRVRIGADGTRRSSCAARSSASG